MAVCTRLLGQLEEGDRLERAPFETEAVLFMHTMRSHFSRTPLKKKVKDWSQLIPHSNKEAIHFSEEMQRSLQEQATLDYISSIHAPFQMRSLLQKQEFWSSQKLWSKSPLQIPQGDVCHSLQPQCFFCKAASVRLCNIKNTKPCNKDFSHLILHTPRQIQQSGKKLMKGKWESLPTRLLRCTGNCREQH